MRAPLRSCCPLGRAHFSQKEREVGHRGQPGLLRLGIQIERLGFSSVAIIDLELHTIRGGRSRNIQASSASHSNELVQIAAKCDRHPLLIGTAPIGPKLDQTAVARTVVDHVPSLAGRVAVDNAIDAVAFGFGTATPGCIAGCRRTTVARQFRLKFPGPAHRHTRCCSD